MRMCSLHSARLCNLVERSFAPMHTQSGQQSSSSPGAHLWASHWVLDLEFTAPKGGRSSTKGQPPPSNWLPAPWVTACTNQWHLRDVPDFPPTTLMEKTVVVVAACSLFSFFSFFLSLIENHLSPPHDAPSKGKGYPSNQPRGAKESAPNSAPASPALGEADINTGL